MSKDVYRAYGRSYVRFGVLKDFSTDGDRITIVNEQNETRIKSKVYSSWTTTADKLKDMIGQDIITSTTAQTPSYANSVFSDVFINRKYTVNLYGDDGEREKQVITDLLQMPRIKDKERSQIHKTAHELILQARIDTQQEAYWAKRQAEYRFGDVEEQNRILTEENANLSKKDKDALVRYEAELKEAMPKWLKADKMRSFRIVGDRGPTGQSLTHFDKEIAMRYRMDTTRMSRLNVAVKQYVNGNFLLGDIVDPLGTGIMSLPRPCILAVMKLHKENAWQVLTVRPIQKQKTWYRLERQFLKDRKDAPEPLEFWFDIHDRVLGQINTI
jgi:hypothetical protein